MLSGDVIWGVSQTVSEFCCISNASLCLNSFWQLDEDQFLAWKKSSDNGELFPAAGESRNIWKLSRFPSFIRRGCHCPPRTFWHFPCNFNFNRSRPDIFLFSAPSNWNQKNNIIICNNGTKTPQTIVKQPLSAHLWDRFSPWAFNGFPAWGGCYLVEKT